MGPATAAVLPVPTSGCLSPLLSAAGAAPAAAAKPCGSSLAAATPCGGAVARAFAVTGPDDWPGPPLAAAPGPCW